MKAALFAGGWEGHHPQQFCDWVTQLIQPEGVEVTEFNTLAPLADVERMREFDVIIPIWSSARSSHQPEFGNITKAEEDGLYQLVSAGCGLAGWHGHMGDAFRDHPTYHFMIGGQFVGHPPGWPDNPVPSDDFIDYDVIIKRPHDPIVAGIPSFRLHSEQYFMLTDNASEVLATTIFSGDHLWWIEGTEVPVIWKRRWNNGRVFYNSIGHRVEDLDHPSVREITKRGILWAASARQEN
jgi:type 1 glutamine amidotransferase